MNKFIKFPFASFCKHLIEETGMSFIYGTTTSIAKSYFDNENNFIIKHISALRKGREYAEYTLLFNILLIASRSIKIRRAYALVFCNTICTYIASKRNGILFTLRSILYNLLSNYLTNFF